jgi:hypothetical protein
MTIMASHRSQRIDGRFVFTAKEQSVCRKITGLLCKLQRSDLFIHLFKQIFIMSYMNPAIFQDAPTELYYGFIFIFLQSGCPYGA